MEIEVLAPFGVAVHGIDDAGVHAHLEALAGLLRDHALVVLRAAALGTDAQIALWWLDKPSTGSATPLRKAASSEAR